MFVILMPCNNLQQNVKFDIVNPPEAGIRVATCYNFNESKLIKLLQKYIQRDGSLNIANFCKSCKSKLRLM